VDKYICLDIGGTDIKYGLADSKGRLIMQDSVPNVIRQQGVQAFVEQVLDLAASYEKYFKVKGVAVSMPGVVDPQNGKLMVESMNFPGSSGLNLAQLITENVNLPCWVENDVNCVALGEYWLGAGTDAKSLFCIAVGTGIGGAFVMNGQLWHGGTWSCGEVGMAKLSGHLSWEKMASVRTLVAKAAQLKNLPEDQVNGKLVCQWAAAGDKAMLRLLRETVHHWAQGIAAICYIVNPQRIILGGGIMASRDLLDPMLRHALQKELNPYIYDHTEIAYAALGNDAGMIGALYNFLWREKKIR